MSPPPSVALISRALCGNKMGSGSARVGTGVNGVLQRGHMPTLCEIAVTACGGTVSRFGPHEVKWQREAPMGDRGPRPSAAARQYLECLSKVAIMET
jgi:hypothetical protein